MKGSIIYKGKYGATRQYAEWLGEELNLPVFVAEEVNHDQLNLYDFLVIGTSVYIGKLQISKWFKKNMEALKNKKIFFFQVAGTPPGEIEKRQVYNQAGIPHEIIGQCEFYFFAGRLIKKNLTWWDWLLLKMGAKLAKDKADRENMLTDYDNVKKENIGGIIITEVKNLQNSK